MPCLFSACTRIHTPNPQFIIRAIPTTLKDEDPNETKARHPNIYSHNFVRSRRRGRRGGMEGVGWEERREGGVLKKSKGRNEGVGLFKKKKNRHLWRATNATLGPTVMLLLLLLLPTFSRNYHFSVVLKHLRRRYSRRRRRFYRLRRRRVGPYCPRRCPPRTCAMKRVDAPRSRGSETRRTPDRHKCTRPMHCEKNKKRRRGGGLSRLFFSVSNGHCGGQISLQGVKNMLSCNRDF